MIQLDPFFVGVYVHPYGRSSDFLWGGCSISELGFWNDAQKNKESTVFSLKNNVAIKYDITILNDVYIYIYVYINTHCNTTFKTVDEHIEPRATHKSAIVRVLGDQHGCGTGGAQGYFT